MRRLLEHTPRATRVPEPERVHCHQRQGLEPAAAPSSVHLLGRALLRQRRLVLEQVAGAAWWSALRVQLAVWAPFDEPDFAVWPQGQAALVWAWDAAALRARCAEQGVSARRIRVLPESLLFGPAPDGVWLCACRQGVEGQFWQGGSLHASRWWPEPPDDQAWLNFQRGAGVPLAQLQPPLPPRSDWRQPLPPGTPLPRLRSPAAATGGSARMLPWALPVLVSLLAAMTLTRLVDLYHYDQAMSALSRDLTRLEAEAAPVLEAREALIRDKQRIDAIRARLVRPSPLALMAHLAECLDATGTRIQGLEWSGDRLRLRVALPETTSQADLVRALEDGGWLLGVTRVTDPLAEGLVLQARLNGASPPATSAAATDAEAP